MPDMRTLNLERFGISKNRYREMKAFCLQYPEWKEKLSCLQDLKGMANGEAVQSGTLGNPTEAAALACMEYSERIGYVESSLEMATGSDRIMYNALLKNITKNMSFEQISPPVSRTVFFEIRTAFFVNLNRKLQYGLKGHEKML